MPMSNDIFVNEAINNGFKVYNEYKDKTYSLEYNTFLTSLVRMLILIYGEEIRLAYDRKDEKYFNSLLGLYGFKEINNFKTLCDKYYSISKKHEAKAIKKKNKYFNLVQKYLIDMMVYKMTREDISKEKEEFYSLLFTANSKDFYRRSVAVVEAYNPYEIDEYAKKKGLCS